MTLEEFQALGELSLDVSGPLVVVECRRCQWTHRASFPRVLSSIVAVALRHKCQGEVRERVDEAIER